MTVRSLRSVKGSEFVVRLPAQVKSGAEVFAPSAVSSSFDSVTAISQRAQRVILVVDDMWMRHLR